MDVPSHRRGERIGWQQSANSKATIAFANSISSMGMRRNLMPREPRARNSKRPRTSNNFPWHATKSPPSAYTRNTRRTDQHALNSDLDRRSRLIAHVRASPRD